MLTNIKKDFSKDLQQLGVSPISPASRSDINCTKNGLPLRSMQLPAIKKFNITGSQEDKIARNVYDIERKMSRNLKISTIRNPLNDYLMDCYTRLYKYANERDNKAFMKLSSRMLKSSITLR